MALWHYNHDEWWAVLRLAKDKGFDFEPAEFSDEEIAEMKRMMLEFNKWQALIAERFKSDNARKWSIVDDWSAP